MTSPRSRRARLLLVALGWLAALLVGVSGCRKRPEPAPLPKVERAAKPAAPDGLIADGFVREPAVVYAALRRLAGPRGEAWPQSLELAVGVALDLPVGVTRAMQVGRPWVVAVVVPNGGAAVPVFGIAIANGAALVEELTGAGSPLRVEVDAGSGVTLFHPAARLQIGVLDDTLLVSPSAPALRLAGPYVARDLARRAPGPEPVAVEAGARALAGPLSAALRAVWSERRSALLAGAAQLRAARGRPADFGDPAAVLELADAAVNALADTLGSCERVRLTLAPGEERLELSLELEPRPSGLAARSTAGLAVGSLDELLALPNEVLFGLLMRVGEKELAEGAREPGGALRALLGSRLSGEDEQAVARSFASFQRGRGTTSVYGLLSSTSLLVRQEVRDEEQLAAGLDGLFSLLRLPAFRAPLTPLFGDVVARRSELALRDFERPLRRMQIALPRAERPGLEALWLVRERSATLSIAPRAEPGFRALEQSTPADTLVARSGLRAMAERRSPAALALYANLGAGTAGAAEAHALFTLGRRGSVARLEGELSRAGALALFSRVVPP